MAKVYVCRYCGREFKGGLGKHELACSKKLGVEFIPRRKARNSDLSSKFSETRYAARESFKNRNLKSDEIDFKTIDLRFIQFLLQFISEVLSEYTSKK